MASGHLGAEEDAEFHDLLASATHNTVVERVMEVIDRLLEDSQARLFRSVERSEISLEGNRRILEAVLRHDEEAAEGDGRAPRRHRPQPVVEMNLREALQEIRTEYRDDAVVITSDRDSPRRVRRGDRRRAGGVARVGRGQRRGREVPATHIFFLDEDGFTRHDGSVLSVVSARDYELLGP